MSRQKEPNILLDEAIAAGNLLAAQQAVAQGADVQRLSGARRGNFIPVFEALKGDVEVLDFIMRTIVDQSRVIEKGVLNKKNTQRVIESNLFGLHDKRPSFMSFITLLAGARTDRLAAVWNNLRGIMDVNHRPRNDEALVHKAAIFPDNLRYLLTQGADINLPDSQGATPLMRMLARSRELDRETVEDLLAIYAQHHADLHAVDKAGRGMAFYALKSDTGRIAAQQECLDWLLEKKVDFLAKDAQGQIATSYLLSAASIRLINEVEMVFGKLADHGYSCAALLRAYEESTVVPKDPRRPLNVSVSASILCLELAQPGLAARLWNPDDSPSTLLLSAFGYGVADKIFQAPCFRDNLPAARALYKKMEEKLPPQCQAMLRTGIDLSFLRDLESQRKPAAITEALKRRSPAPKGKNDNSPAGGR